MKKLSAKRRASRALGAILIALFFLSVSGDASAQYTPPIRTLQDIANDFMRGRPNPALTDQELINGIRQITQTTTSQYYVDPADQQALGNYFDGLQAQAQVNPLSVPQRVALNEVIASQGTAVPINVELTGAVKNDSQVMYETSDGAMKAANVTLQNVTVTPYGDAVADPDFVKGTKTAMEELIHSVTRRDEFLIDGVTGTDLTTAGVPLERLSIEIEAKSLAWNDLGKGVAEAEASGYGTVDGFLGMDIPPGNLTPEEQAGMVEDMVNMNGGRALPTEMQVGLVQDLPADVLTGARPLLQAAPGDVPPVISGTVTVDPPPIISPATAAADTDAATAGLGATLGGGAKEVLSGVAEKLWLVQLIYEGGEGAIAWYTSGIAYPDDPVKASNYAWASFSGHLSDEIGGIAQGTMDIALQTNPLTGSAGNILFGTYLQDLTSTVSAAVRSGAHEFFDTIFDVQPGDDGSLDGQINPFGYSLQGMSTIQALALTQSQFPMYTGDYYTGGATFNFAPVTTANTFAWNAGIQTGFIPAGTSFGDYNGQTITFSVNEVAGIDSNTLDATRAQFTGLSTPSSTSNCAAYGLCGVPSDTSGASVSQDFQLLSPSALEMTQSGTNYTFNVSSAWTAPQTVVYSNPVYNTVPDSVTSPYLINAPLSADDPFARNWQPPVDLSVSPIITGFVTDPSVLQPLSFAFTNAIWNGDAQVGLTNGASIFSTPTDGIGYFGNTGAASDNPGDASDWQNIPDTMSDGAWSDDD